jgi:hypothetical protein
MCGDSALSEFNINTGEIKRVNGCVQKIYQIGKYVIFFSGYEQLSNLLIQELWKVEELNFNIISRKAKEIMSRLPQNTDKYKPFALEIVVSTNYEGKLISCVMSSKNNMEIELKEEKKELIMFNGCDCDKLKQKYIKYANKVSNVRELYLNIYREMESEVPAIGGVLTVYKLDKNQINLIIQEDITPKNVLLHLFQDGSYSEMVQSGFHHVDGDGIHDYHYLAETGRSDIVLTGLTGLELISGQHDISLPIPPQFANKNYAVLPTITAMIVQKSSDGSGVNLQGWDGYMLSQDISVPNFIYRLQVFAEINLSDTYNLTLRLSYMIIA